MEYGEKKQAYDTLLLQLESGMSRLDAEVRKWQEEIMSNETKLHTLEQQMALLDMWQGRAEAELKVRNILKVTILVGKHLPFIDLDLVSSAILPGQ